jgi:ATP-binding cassette, subfamily B, bacterial
VKPLWNHFVRVTEGARPTSTPSQEPARGIDWRKRVAALRNIVPVMRLAWGAAARELCFSFGFRLLDALLPICALWVAKLIIDQVVATAMHRANDHSLIWTLVALEFAIAVAGEVLTRAIEYTDGIVALRFTNHVSLQLMEHVSTLDLATLEDPAFLDKLERARGGTGRIDLLSSMAQVCQRLVMLVSYALGALWFSPLLFALMTGAVIPAFVGQIYFTSMNYALMVARTPYVRQMDYLRLLGASYDSAKEVKVFGLEGWLISRFRDLADRILRDHRSLSRRRAIVGSLLTAIGTAGYYLAYVIVLYRTLHGILSVGDLTFLAGTFLRARTSLQGVFAGFTSMAEQSMVLNSLVDFFAVKPTIVSVTATRRAPRPIRRGIEFRNVSFRYPSGEAVLWNVSFTLKPGEQLALVGENGAGKTTIVKLMARLYDPTAGQILLDDVDLREYAVKDLQREIGIIFQDYLKFQMPVRDNIGLGRVEHLDDLSRVRWAAEMSRAAEVIARLPGEYDQMLGRRFEGGIELSGGEWQRIALSRAHMRDPQLLILDEPTAALDARAEYEIFRSFVELARNRMTLLISHRFSTVRMADRILVLERGEIREYGSHADLLALGGRYAELFHLQANGYQ